jgi:hypothetical protein
MPYLAVDFQSGWNDAWSSVATFVPKLLAALVIFIIGYFVAKALANITNRVLERVGFDRAVERGGLRRALARSKYDPSDILAKLVYWAVLLLTLQLAFGIFGPNPVSDLLAGIIAYLPRIFVAILILVIAGAVAKAVRDLLGSVLSGVSFGPQLATAAGIAIVVLGAFAALDQLAIAPEIVSGLWWALLAVVAGSLIISFGVGGIPVARGYLQRMAARAEERAPEVRAAASRRETRPVADPDAPERVFPDPGDVQGSRRPPLRPGPDDPPAARRL